jgi:1,2-diacylglycerol 3-alpha-glucosyltransferase
MQQALVAYGVSARIDILPTGLPAERFQAGDGNAFRRRHGLNQEQPLLLFVGRAAHEKNIGFPLQMMLVLRKRSPDALLLIAGEGPAALSLRAQASRLGLDGSVRFLGYFDRGGELQDCLFWGRAWAAATHRMSRRASRRWFAASWLTGMRAGRWECRPASMRRAGPR